MSRVESRPSSSRIQPHWSSGLMDPPRTLLVGRPTTSSSGSMRMVIWSSRSAKARARRMGALSPSVAWKERVRMAHRSTHTAGRASIRCRIRRMRLVS